VDALVRERRFDAAHVDTIGLAPLATRVPAPLVQNHHNVESAMMERRAASAPSALRRALYRSEARKLAELEWRCADYTALHLAVSELDAERLRERVGAADVRVVANGVDTDWFAPRRALGHGDGGLVFAGAMDWYPNREATRWLVREIWPLLAADRPERRLAIVGRAAPAEVAGAARADARVEAPGFVGDVRPWLDDASIYLCPIRDGGGTRLKVLDALAMAKPLVATALAVEGLGLEAERHYLRAEAPHEWLAQVRRLESDAALRRRLAEAGRRLVARRFDWSVIGRALVAAHRDAARAARPLRSISGGTRAPAPDTAAPLPTRRCPDAAESEAG
ncbi:MAG: hypothetical protein DCC71_24025, partial [Proteobacteria bacterium]